MEEQIFLQQLPNEFNFPKNEENIMKYWDVNKIYWKNIEKNVGNHKYQQIDGPPFTSSSSLHWGHIHISMMKSSNMNYWTMQGYDVFNKLGYDVHGLPVELAANKNLQLMTNQDVIDYGIAKYNEYCVNMINGFMGSWHPVFDRVGRFFDKTNEYKTMDLNYMESVWWIWKQLWDKGLVYRGYKIMPYSIECGTSLSSSEASGDDVYKEISDPSVYVKFKIKNTSNLYFVAWTTTPWTLPSNLALAMNPKLEYIKIHDIRTNDYYIISLKSLNRFYPQQIGIIRPFNILSTHKGEEFNDMEYEPIFDYYKNDRLNFKVLMADFVDDTSGTGIVHIAPSFGNEDFELCIKKDIVKIDEIGKYCPIDENGFFTNKIYDLVGTKVFDANLKIIKKLIDEGKLVRKENYRHRYPHCWRTDTPLIQKAVSSFFIKASALRDRMVKNNEKVKWVPKEIGSGRFKSWLEGATDWGVSRSRFFGNPIPVWVSNDGEEMICIGSIDELVQLAGLKERPANLHPEFIKDITIPSKMGKGTLRWEGSVMDCWLESACVPLAQYHYPFENKELVDEIIKTGYLSEFVSEGSDQVNKWFYVLTVISTALFDIPAFKNVVCNGLILSETGEKFSKRLNNFIPPMELCNEIGADAIRMYFVGSPASHGSSFTFDKSKIHEINFKYFQWLNCNKFFIEHHTKYQKDGNIFRLDAYLESTNVTDNWILSRLGEIVNNINSVMSEYLLYKVKPELLEFIEDLTNWYIKFNRNRLRGRYCDSQEQGRALSTLYRVLVMFSKISAPFIPFLSETLYLTLKPLLSEKERMESVHMCDYPKETEFPKDAIIIRRMKRLQQVAKMVRVLRTKSKNFNSVKTPIKNITIVHDDEEFIDDLKIFEKYMFEELNSIRLSYSTHVDAKYKVEPNHKLIGANYRKLSNQIKEKLLTLDQDTIKQYLDKKESDTNLSITLSDGSIINLHNNMYTIVKDEALSLGPNELGVADNNLIVILDANYDNEVIEKYLMRLFIVTVQKMRKNTNLRPWNKIGIYYKTQSELVKNAIINNQKNINEELFYEVKYLEDDVIIKEKIIISQKVNLERELVNIIITDQYSQNV
ncbi:isoleucyl-tRNA synthetase [Indivirus ILV1]|uniref:isoleucine--tRNA ligase n=1 Tax=Indivirus ILV1 TaxID=1977633 RepID=A0A1V0SD71_9VIRU|nr:isoleucyl-tRNA synthetase [Indivirus ILV1]